MPRQSGMSALEKEWKAIEKREQRLAKLALQGKDSAWKGKLEEKVPPKVSRALEAAFCKAFALVFEKGTGIIEKSYDSADLRQDLFSPLWDACAREGFAPNAEIGQIGRAHV